jgi:predicted LPLAT superfamily acyltransferase
MPQPAHQPVDGSRAPDWLARPERSNMLALRFMAWAVTALGRPLTRLLLYPICVYYVAFSPRARAASRQYLDRVLGRKAGLADCFRHYHSFASVLLDRVALLKGRASSFAVRVYGAEVVEQMVADGQGCILLGAHLGSFEITRYEGRTRGRKVSMLMYEENARMFSAMVRAIDPTLQTQVIALGQLDAMLKVEAALARGEVVGMLADRTLDDAATVRCPFLGAPARFPTGPMRIAVMLNRPMALLFGLYRGGNRYDIHIERFAEPDQVRSLTRAVAVERLLRRYAERLEHYCRSAPYNWFNFYDFWR